jgi:Tol biopolymer transport system component
MSRATNLVPADTNGVEDVFVRDRETQTTQRVSVSGDGSQLPTASLNPSISADGRYVGFVTGSNSGQGEAMVHDRQTGVTIRLSTPMGGGTADHVSDSPVLSADGRYAVFMSYASNLVPDDINGSDIFVYEMATGQLSLVSVGAQGQSNGWTFLPAISGDGRYVTFASQATNLVHGHTGNTMDVYQRDRVGGITTLVSATRDGTLSNEDSFGSAMDYTGRYIVYETGASNLVPGDTNGRPDVLLYDRQTRQTRTVAAGIDGAFANAGSGAATLDAAAKHVAWASDASNLIRGDTNALPDIFAASLLPPCQEVNHAPSETFGPQAPPCDGGGGGGLPITGAGVRHTMTVGFAFLIAGCSILIASRRRAHHPSQI